MTKIETMTEVSIDAARKYAQSSKRDRNQQVRVIICKVDQSELKEIVDIAEGSFAQIGRWIIGFKQIEASRGECFRGGPYIASLELI